jgi:aldehyde:ferredoxin oxidoreductase
MTGWSGKVLRVDLSSGELTEEGLPLRLAEQYIGGRGLAGRIMLDELRDDVDPLDADNVVVIATGPLGGTGALAASRYSLATKSPLTRGLAWGDSGGQFGADLKSAGYDLLVIRGKATEPVYVWVHDGEAEIRSADGLWGKDTHECHDMITDELGAGHRVACIGPAGERLASAATVVNEKLWAVNAAGIGAVLGSKHLKAVAVKGGTSAIGVSDTVGFRRAALGSLELLKRNSFTARALPRYGSAMLADIVNDKGALPTHNFRRGVFPELEKINGFAITSEILKRRIACFGCPVSCVGITSTNGDVFEGGCPEYGDVWALGACCDVHDLKDLARASYACLRFGLDAIECGVTIACALELYDSGFLDQAEVGFEAGFGDGRAVNLLIEAMAMRRGFGDLLAQGGQLLAERFGHPELFMGVRGGALAAHDPRGDDVMSLRHATASHRPSPVPTFMIPAADLGLAMGARSPSLEEAVSQTRAHQDFVAVTDSAGLCRWATVALGLGEIAHLLQTATGLGYDRKTLREIGQRVWNTERLFNQRSGPRAVEDELPRRMLEEPLRDGPGRPEVSRLEELLAEYYAARGWDSEGHPTEKTLSKLGVSSQAGDS